MGTKLWKSERKSKYQGFFLHAGRFSNRRGSLRLEGDVKIGIIFW